MRTLRLLLLLALPGAASTLAWSTPAHAQVTEAERAAARQLFKEGDELQRAGKLTEALDKFQRAQQVFSAPTNVLRIAECNAALGHLVVSAESYRALVRTPLPAGSPPAFQAAVDQARAELAQVEPRVPKLVVQVDPPGVPGPQLQIDGQAVPAALFGEPFPLDPGPHKVLVYASGYVSAEQSVVLKERETRSLVVPLKSIAGVTYAPGSTPPPPPVSTDTAQPAQGAPGMPPPPPAIVDANAPGAVHKRPRVSLLLGLHLGLELPAGQVPNPNGGTMNTADVSGGGLAYALDAGVRFARYGYVGLTLEHAGLGAGKTPASIDANASGLSSNTTSFGAVIGVIANPDRVSFFGELGVQGRWYSLSWKENGASESASYPGVELLIGMGLWLPIGQTFRLLPEVTGGVGSFSPPNTAPSGDTNGVGHGFVMLGVGGLFNIDL
ncbi:MAG TPA: hypothetical protein VHS09_14310 [Polyangiaceae bacterium]|jgi:hypothetical protein|nr:hypothetical protein [Polyangiaceae bacterium]